MTSEERKTCFENWAYGYGEANGLSANTVKLYISSLNRLWKNAAAVNKKQSPYDYVYYYPADIAEINGLSQKFNENGDFGDSDCRQGFNLYLKFLNVLKGQPFGGELIKFRNLLKWFVWQIRVNNGILGGERHSGSGYKQGAAIRRLYGEWREYQGFTLDCTLFADFRNDTSANYIHLTNTWVNITPVFTKKENVSLVTDLQITIKPNGAVKRQYPAFAVENLAADNNDYSGDYCPYDLKDFFALFKEEIKFNQTTTDINAASKETKMNAQPKNIIFYGPLGTGKTYNTVLKAMQIIAPEKNYNSENYDEAKAEYDKLLGDRIQFVTFHQSYGYEEFIEGIKPETTPNGQIEYKIVSGVFKTFCDRASAPPQERDFAINPKAAVWKVSLEGTGDNATRRECLENGHIRIGFDGYGEHITDDTVYDPDTGGKRELNAFINKMRIGDIVLSCYSSTTIDAIGIVTGIYEWHDEYDKYKRQRDVKWIAKDINEDITKLNNDKTLTRPSVYNLNVSTEDVIKLANKYNPPKKGGKNPPYVFIIDEINRGNISKIFGELITLIEETKRMGKKEGTTVELPYSKQKFAVPSNVYVIGTMNTADRSIAAIDAALRRRFHFVEMMPDMDYLKGITVGNIDVCEMLKTINRRVEILFDREHVIGHAYFKELKKNADISVLANIFEMNIIPLLQEYFYEDYEKIRLVLGDNQKTDASLQFITKNKIASEELFGTNGGIELDAEYSYSINKNALNEPMAYIGIYAKING